MLTLLLASMLTLTFNTQPVKASGTIYIRADGRVDPPTAPISTVDYVKYTLTGNIYNSIEVQRNNIVVNGAGYTVRGIGSGAGIALHQITNVTIRNVVVKAFYTGIWLDGSSNNSISGNNITSNLDGVALGYSSNNSISGNNIASNREGIWVGYSSNQNSIYRNNITANNYDGLHLESSSNNIIYHNNFIDNTAQVHSYTSTNVWDNGYPSGGNYWSDYSGVDIKSGPCQDQPGSDRIGDTHYVISVDNVDHYPLMNPYGAPSPRTYNLSITATVGGTTDPAQGTYRYTANAVVEVAAVPDTYFVLDHWELDGVNVGSANPYSVLMDNNHTLHAVFVPITYTLTITTTTGGTTSPSPSSYVYDAGTSVSVTAISDAYYSFDHWELDGVNVGSSNPYSVLIDNNYVLYAIFRLLSYTLTITSTSGGTTNPAPSSYVYDAGTNVPVTAIANNNCRFDHWELDGIDVGSANPISVTIDMDHLLHTVFMPHDVAVTNVTFSKTVVGQGYSLKINITVVNQGGFTETFNITVHANAIIIATLTNITLTTGTSTTFILAWNTAGFAKGSYTISAYAWPVPGETDTTDNNSTNGWVSVAVVGDITGGTPNPYDFIPDGKVDIRDVALVAKHFGQNVPPAPRNCDITGPTVGMPDGKIDIRDIATIAIHFGEIDPKNSFF